MSENERIVEVTDDDVLAVLDAHPDRGLYYSEIAAELYDRPRSQVTMPQVRGVRDAIKRLAGSDRCLLLVARGIGTLGGRSKKMAA